MEITGKIRQSFDEDYTAAKTFKEDHAADEIDMSSWSKFETPSGDIYDTSVAHGTLVALGVRAFTLPEDFNIHPIVKKTYAARIE